MRRTIRRSGGICVLAFGQPRLDGCRAGHRADDGAELRDEAVAHQLDEAAPVLGQKGFQHGQPEPLQGRERAGLVSLDEARVADHVGSHDGRQPSLDSQVGHGGSLPSGQSLVDLDLTMMPWMPPNRTPVLPVP